MMTLFNPRTQLQLEMLTFPIITLNFKVNYQLFKLSLCETLNISLFIQLLLAVKMKMNS